MPQREGAIFKGEKGPAVKATEQRVEPVHVQMPIGVYQMWVTLTPHDDATEPSVDGQLLRYIVLRFINYCLLNSNWKQQCVQ